LQVSANDRLAEIARCKSTDDAALKFGRSILEKRRQVTENPDPIDVRKSLNLQKHAFEGRTELDRVSAFVEEGIVISLERIPVIEVGRQASHATRHIRKRRNPHQRRVAIRKSAQCRISRLCVKCLCAFIVVYDLTVKAKSHRIYERRRKAVRLLSGEDLSRRQRRELNIPHRVRRAVGGLVEKVRTEQAVLL